MNVPHLYNAIRNAAALIDVSPLFKYLIRGRDAVKLVDRVITRDAYTLAVGQVFNPARKTAAPLQAGSRRKPAPRASAWGWGPRRVKDVGPRAA